MSRTSVEGPPGMDEQIRGVKAAAATYAAGEVVVLDTTNDRFRKSTTRAQGACVVAYDTVVAANDDYLQVIYKGAAYVKFDAVCEEGDAVVPSDATAGNAEKWVVQAAATPSEAEIQAGWTYNRMVFARTREEVTDTTSYFLIGLGDT